MPAVDECLQADSLGDTHRVEGASNASGFIQSRSGKAVVAVPAPTLPFAVSRTNGKFRVAWEAPRTATMRSQAVVRIVIAPE
jgi:hypothetical protein